MLLLHLPFLHADPDYFLSIGRDAFTDEGLNASQVRNFINHHYLDPGECDNLVKSPLFNIILLAPLKFFGTHLIVARLTILACLTAGLLLLLSSAYFTSLLPILFFTTLTQYYIFQYSHFSLSEMLAVTSILSGILFLFRFITAQRQGFVFVSALFFSLAWYAKIQFAYIIVLLPISIFIVASSEGIPLKWTLRSISFLKGIAFLLFFITVYLLCWYLPFRSTYNYIMSDQTSGKFADVFSIPKSVVFNTIHVLFNPQNWWLNSLVAICFVAGIFLYRNKGSHEFKIMFILTSLWLLLELHKLAMIYLPSRYLVSYYFAGGLMSSVVIQELLASKKQMPFARRFLYPAAIAIVLLFAAANILDYAALLNRRTYQVEAINNYFSATIKNESQPIMGPWSPSATWDCKARCIPVWKDFMNDTDIINRFHPQVILSEPDEAESNQAYSSQGMSLEAISDSSRRFTIGRWIVVAYWLK